MNKTLKINSALAFASVAALAFGTAFAQDPTVKTVTPYGFARFNAAWSDGIGGDAPNGTTSAAAKAEKGEYRFGVGATQSRLGFNFAGPSFEGGALLSGKIEGDFAPGTLRLRQGFANLSFPNVGLNILVGQTWDLFAPNDPNVVNFGSLNTEGDLAGNRKTQIRLTQKLGSSADIAVAAVSKKTNSDNSGDYPGVQARIGINAPVKFGVSGHYSTGNTASADEDHSLDLPATWGVAADLSAAVSIISLTGEFFYGQNLSAVAGLGKTHKEDGEDKGTNSLGGFGNIGIQATDKLSFNLGAGIEYAGDNPENELQTNGAGYANLQYKLAPSATVALEYFRQQSEYVGGAKGNFNRVETSLTYAF
ncbi:hypothetical protein AGMMS49938_07030 [Fibrobacterales bacterium]|nr:hypothetical protein AGMMS49938_07030 [Fibrobacterales bacterium]